MQVNYKRYGLYLLRWQASTPILAGVGILLAPYGWLVAAILANLIGGLIFFWVDQFIFTSQSLAAQWEVKDNISCVDCGKVARGYRLVRSGEYDRSQDVNDFNRAGRVFRVHCSRKRSSAAAPRTSATCTCARAAAS